MSATPGPARLTNPASDRVKSVARLVGRSARRRSGLFVAEGPQAVREAIPSGLVRDLYLDDDGAARHPELLATARDARIPTYLCRGEVMAALSDTVTPQGLVAVCASVTTDLPTLVGTIQSARPAMVSVLAQARDPGNAGTVIRATDAAGGVGVVFTDSSVDPLNPKCVRATAGSLFHLDVVADVSLTSTVETLREAGMAVLAADGAGDQDLDALSDAAEQGSGPLAGSVVWVFGNEAWGVPDEDLRLADAVVRVPVHGRAESLNLAMAATVCLYATARAQRRQVEIPKDGRWRRRPPSASPPTVSGR